ncbi:hypothetical protein [Leptolyngbya sp. FACHB-261]|uniref:hypothetical protein n=1 Tax=Leptolyngbya sp. FACHB-261 TaxID=2692806 RepID=UPI0016882047|nr:hypothetical protein [Leptolyngbya sp. FACHB-261]MBD2104612.1 hypothetical protein [Leptolyngbya sp. FACHB-261]
MSNAPSGLSEDLNRLSSEVHSLAQSCQGNAVELLALLRLLENLHHEIRDTFFQEALPSNRQALYSLLRDIENAGGWPSIPRLKLRELLIRLQAQEIFPAENNSHRDSL